MPELCNDFFVMPRLFPSYFRVPVLENQGPLQAGFQINRSSWGRRGINMSGSRLGTFWYTISLNHHSQIIKYLHPHFMLKEKERHRMKKLAPDCTTKE